MIPIPDDVKFAIRNYILHQCPKATNGWKRANENEDTLTGDFLGSLASDDKTKTGNFWWEVTYNKPRSQGIDSMESLTGGDGIITIHAKDVSSKSDYYKSVVFQAKKEGNKIDISQQNKMKDCFPGGFFNLHFSSKKYTGKIPGGNDLGVCELLAYNFLNCSVGIEGLFYDSDLKKYVLDHKKISQLKIPHELIIKVFR
ncbi:MAG: hypothetical protein GXC73_17190 [Chitinophagaceae bacterium]|nr:hypothetical protein [Chitinophagaceae bacterium]